MKKDETLGIVVGAAAMVGAFLWARKHTQGTSGIGAAKKRRIYKELSLAQQSGVDFTKPYDELTEDEILALQRVSNETGYTETYYKSLQKAYNAISGIGETYDVVNENGETVLTWIEDPELQQNKQTTIYDPERDRAYLEAVRIDEDRRWEQENKTREFEEREKRLAEQRRRLKKSSRTSQMALFGMGYAPEVEAELYEIWREQIEYDETEYDYDTWRRLVGNEYAKDVLKYMR